MTIGIQTGPETSGPAPIVSTGRTSPRGMVGTIIFAVQPIVMNIISIPITAFIIRRLGPVSWGQFSTAAGLILTVQALTSMGLRGQFVRAVARDRSQAPHLFAEQVGLRLLLSLIAGSLAVGIALAMRHPTPVVICTLLGAISLGINSTSFTGIDYFQATGRLPVVAAIGMAQGLVLTFGSALVVWAGAGPIGLGCAYLLGPITFTSIATLVLIREGFPLGIRWDLRRFFGHLKQARFLAAQQIVSSLGRNAEALMAPRIVGMGRYGLFSAGTMLSDRMSAVPDGLGTALYPIVAAEHDRDPSRASREVASFLTLTLALCLPLCLVSTSVAEQIAGVLFPTDVETCALVIRITIWALPLMGIDILMNYGLNACGRETSQTWAVLFSSMTTLAVSAFLIARFGLVGACASWVVRYPINICFRLPDFIRSFRASPRSIPLLRIAACNLGLFALLRWLHPVIWGPDSPALTPGPIDWFALLGRLVLEGSLAMSLYGSAAIALRVIGHAEFAALLRRFRGRSGD